MLNRAALNREKTHFMIAGEIWRSDWKPVAKLADEIAFYQRLHDRKNGQFSRHYAVILGKLKDLQKQVKEAARHDP
jgi:uncharacterized protein involved in exopolysaccharide biosynthesis